MTKKQIDAKVKACVKLIDEILAEKGQMVPMTLMKKYYVIDIRSQAGREHAYGKDKK